MEVMTATWPVESRYLAVFKRHIVKRTGMILVRVRQVAPYLPSDLLKQALHILDYSLKLPEAWPCARDLLLVMAPRMEQAGYRDEWMPYLQQGIDRSRQAGDPAACAELHLQLGILYQLRSKYEEARSHLEASAKEFARLNDPHKQARALNRLAYVARLQRRFEEATSLVATSRRLLEKDDIELAYGYFVLGLVALDKRNWPEAVHFSQEAFGRWEQTNNQRMMGRSLMCLGVALEKMGEFSESIKASEQAIVLFQAIDDPIYLAAVQMNLGNVYNALEQPGKALSLFVPAKKIFQRVQDRVSLAMVTHNMGMAYHRLQRWDEAKDAYLLSIQHKREIGNIIALVNSMDGLGRMCLDQSKLLEAKATFEEALSELTKVEGDAGYEQRLKMVIDHLREVKERLNDQ